MCTLTWWQDDSRYALFFNRDEQKTRLPAAPPEIRTDRGVRFITPIDGDRGGTWVLANEHGLSLAILNFYDAAIDPVSLPEESPSRGRLVLSLAASRTLEAVGESLQKRSLEDYWPFHLFAITPGATPRHWTWSGPGTTLSLNSGPQPPLTTSSIRTGEVCAVRIKRYREMLTAEPDPLGAHRNYHRFFDPADPAASVRMRRDEAQTLSYSEILVDNNTVRFTYRPDTIDSLELNETVITTLPRRD